MTRRRQPDDTLHGMTRGFDIIKALFDAARRKGLNPEEFLKSVHTATDMADVMVDAAIAKLRPQTPAPKPVAFKTLDLKVYTTPSIRTNAKKGAECYRELRDATGCDVWPHADQDEVWATEETSEETTDLMLLCLGFDAYGVQVDYVLEEHGLVDATSTDLLNFSAAPETCCAQLEFPIAARGTVAKIDGNDYVLNITVDDGKRVLRECLIDHDVWDGHQRFLVRKAPPLVTPTP